MNSLVSKMINFAQSGLQSRHDVQQSQVGVVDDYKFALNSEMIHFPSPIDRVETWDRMYQEQGKRWGETHSLLAHIALADIYKLTKGTGALLDIGCGYARDLLFFHSIFPSMKLLGVEPSQTARNIANKAVGFDHSIEISDGSILDDANWPYCKVDFIFLNYVLHLLSVNELIVALKAISRLLRPGGELIFSLVSLDDRHFGHGRQLGPKCFEVESGVPWLFSGEREIFSMFAGSGLLLERVTPYSEIEIVMGDIDEVEALLVKAVRVQ